MAKRTLSAPGVANLSGDGRSASRIKRERAKDLRQHMTKAETMLWARLRTNQVLGLHFRRQHVIEGFIVDFYCHSARLVVELDGNVHETTTAYDAERDRILAGRGLRVMRILNSDVEQDVATVIERIALACQP